MTEKQYSLVYYPDKGGAFIKNNETGNEWYHDSRASLLEVVAELNRLNERNMELLNEIEQLKSVVKEVIELLSNEVDIFSDKATEHDINAYIELKELDNKDAYYMATATKKAIKLLKGVADD